MTEDISGPEELSSQWYSLNRAERLRGFRNLPPGEDDDFFLNLDTEKQVEIIVSLPSAERRIWMRLLPPDDAADLIQNAPDEDRDELLSYLDPTTRREVQALLAFREDEAGGLMNPRFARVRPEMTVDEALAYVRQQTSQVETIYYVYALDSDQHLLGVVSLRDLFSYDRTRRVDEVMRTKFLHVSEDADQEEVANLFGNSHLLALPVVDAQNRMIGIVTIDDVVAVVREETNEDIQKYGGMEALDGPYLEVGFWQMVRKRAGWLAILFVGEMLTATAMGYFEGEIAKAVVLALFPPLIISSGGNSGSQASTLVIRAMALGEVHFGDWFRVVRREIFAGFALGLVLATIGVARIYVWHSISGAYGPHYGAVALTIAVSLIGVVVFGTFAGSILPFILRRCGLDPASASAPFVATLVDVTGLVIYFTTGSVILRGTLL